MNKEQTNHARRLPRLFWPAAAGLVLLGAIAALIAGRPLLAASCLVWGGALLALIAFRPGSSLYHVTVGDARKGHVILIALLCAATIFACVWPMKLDPVWNGEYPQHRDQYERMAEALLSGHLYMDYPQEELDALASLENPYDPQEREDAGITYRWDHAYYKGRYYMYFGVVPVLLVFLPWRVITGQPLTTYHATQLFVALFILGLFRLFWQIARKYFRSLPLAVYAMLSTAFSILCVWYAAAEPALYSTAITAALCLMIWSLDLFFRAVWIEEKENRQILLAFFGAACGALAFGCRPPVALANLMVLPMLAVFLRQRRFTLKLAGKLLLAALPYALVAAALMLYNRARFDDPFEFGQAYQLTVADQHLYGSPTGLLATPGYYLDVLKGFLALRRPEGSFPWLAFQGVFFNFPILFLSLGLLSPRVFSHLRAQKLAGFTAALPLTAVVILCLDRLWSPFLMERYNMDIYFLLVLLCFIVIAALLSRDPTRPGSWGCFLVMLLGMITLGTCVLLFLKPVNSHLTQVYPSVLDIAERILLPFR